MTNLPGHWPGTEVTGPITAALGARTAIINDARAFTLAETRLGAGRGRNTVIGLTLGTGIGGGLVFDGRPAFGPNSRRGEFGHLVIFPEGPLCGCGGRGCLEVLGNAAALATAADTDTAEAAIDAAERGEPRAMAAVEAVADVLGRGIANLVTLFVPDLVVIGGGVATAGTTLIDPIRRAARRYQHWIAADTYDIVAAELGSTAGAIGAALWGLEHTT